MAQLGDNIALTLSACDCVVYYFFVANNAAKVQRDTVQNGITIINLVCNLDSYLMQNKF